MSPSHGGATVHEAPEGRIVVAVEKRAGSTSFRLVSTRGSPVLMVPRGGLLLNGIEGRDAAEDHGRGCAAMRSLTA